MTEKELTAKEKKRLKMVALGDTAQEIAEREYRAVHSINKCIESVKKKLGGRNALTSDALATRTLEQTIALMQGQTASTASITSEINSLGTNVENRARYGQDAPS